MILLLLIAAVDETVVDAVVADTSTCLLCLRERNVYEHCCI